MTVENKIPSVKEVQEALQAREQALLLLTLKQKAPTSASILKRLEDTLPGAGLLSLFEELELIKQKFNAGLQAEVTKLVEKANDLSDRYLKYLFSVDSLPAFVTLPEDFDGKQATHVVAGLESVRDNGEGPYGFITVMSYDGRSRSSERFFTRDGKLHFASPDLY
jgi:hypothetical protein